MVIGGSSEAWLSVSRVSKRFGGVQALRAASLDIRRAEVHGLVGANGAGKSTLIRILAGLVAPDGGTITVDDADHERLSPTQAKSAGLAFIHQELSLVGHMNAVENAFLGVPKPERLGIVNWRAAEKQVRETLERLGGTFSLRRPAAELSVADQWLIVIARALMTDARLIAMDEPTASLSAEESERLFAIVRQLSADGISVLYVSHKLDEITSLCDRVTVFRNGASVTTVGREELTRDELVRLIVGHELGEVTRLEHEASPADAPLLRVENMSRRPAVNGVSLSLRAGEIVGLAGLVGAGRTELARLIVGADKAETGTVYFDGRKIGVASPHDAMRHGIAYVPEERRSQGLLLLKSVDFNISLASLQHLRPIPALPLINKGKSQAVSRELVKRLSIRTPSLQTPVGLLSGGNQQKVLVARYVAANCRALILDEPTRGVDVGAREEMYQVMSDLAGQGIGIVFISSDPEELIGRCDRIVVMAHGTVVATVNGSSTSKEELVQLSYSEPEEAAV